MWTQAIRERKHVALGADDLADHPMASNDHETFTAFFSSAATCYKSMRFSMNICF